MPQPRRYSARLLPALAVVLAVQVVLLALTAVSPARLVDGSIIAWGVQLLALLSTAVIAFRVYLAARYRPAPDVPDEMLPTLTVIVPAYNEGRQVLSTLRSLAASRYPAEKLQIIAVDDGSRDDTWAWMTRSAQELGGRLTTIRCPVNGGKRRALNEGFRRARGDILLTVDSDSEVLPDTLRRMVAPFVADPRCGAVAGNVRVLNREQGALPKMLDASFTAAFDFTRAGESELGAVMCTPGALSAYRADLVREVLDEWLGQTFFGRPATIGEDRAMTNLILRSGATVRYQADAIVLTQVPTRTAQLCRMLLRWARSNVRESIVLGSFLFRAPIEGGVRRRGLKALFLASVLRLLIAAVTFVPLVALVVLKPHVLAGLLAVSLLVAVGNAAVIHATRGSSVALWAFPWAVYALLVTSWITPWALLTPHNGGWLTRGRVPARTPAAAIPLPLPARRAAPAHAQRPEPVRRVANG